MQYIKFKELLREFTVFSINDIKRIEKDFHRRRLNEWQDKGYIKKVIKGYYIFSDIELTEDVLFEIANRIHSPSYISLEMALSYYHLIPESVYGITSVSTLRTYKFDTPISRFIYRRIKPSLFFGYRFIKYSNKKSFKIATIEKCILDYFYLNPHIETRKDFDSLRINPDILLKHLNKNNLYIFLERFGQDRLKKRVKSFLRFIENA
ncbi:MAG: hypothetical protein B5M53_11910 [Candidatus Cloacimonas sp. 4484_209]|nr:MAG: hypothetical protein B5M53_11910 [Candidatus Cloacimonas sp. 4484_209]